MKKSPLHPADRLKRSCISLALFSGLLAATGPAVVTGAAILGFTFRFSTPLLSGLLTLGVIATIILIFGLVGFLVALYRLNRALWRQALPNASEPVGILLAVVGLLPVGNRIVPVLLAHLTGRRQTDRGLARWTIAATWIALVLPFGFLAASGYLELLMVSYLATACWLAAYGLLTIQGLRTWRKEGVESIPLTPCRKYFIRTAAAIELGVLAAVFASWGFFAWYAPHELRRAEAMLKTHDIPLTPEEMFAKYPSPSEGDAEYLKKLFIESDQTIPDELYRLAPAPGVPPPPEAVALLPQLEQQTERIQLLEELPNRPELHFDRNWRQGPSMLLPEIGRSRTLAYFLTLRMYAAAQRGDRTLALQLWDQGAALTRPVRTDPVLISQLVANAIESIRLLSLEGLLSQLNFTDAELRQLMKSMQQSEQSILPAFRSSVDGEFNMMNVTFSFLRRNDDTIFKLVPADPIVHLRWNCFPFIQLVDLNQANYYRELIHYKSFCLQEYYVNATAIAEWGRHVLDDCYLQTLGPRLLLPALDRALISANQTVALLRCARTALAAELYRRQYGKWPQQPADLVPEFLAEVPLDPFDGNPLRFIAGELPIYLPTYILPTDDQKTLFDVDWTRAVRPGFRVYSVGPDGKDDHGEPRSKKDQRPTPPPFDVGFFIYDRI